eukprot:9504062-Pyramimonas_sp.AAC.1
MSTLSRTFDTNDHTGREIGVATQDPQDQTGNDCKNGGRVSEGYKTDRERILTTSSQAPNCERARSNPP